MECRPTYLYRRMQSRSSRGLGRSHALGLCVGPRTRSWLSASFVGLLVIAALTAAPKCVQARKFGPQAAKTEGSQRAAYEAMFAASSSAPQLDQQNQAATSSPETQQQAAKQLYLLLYYVDTGATGIHAAVSTDGMHFHAVGPNEARSPVLMPTVGSPRVARDPSIAQNPKDGRFHLVWRAGWDDTMGYATSLDLVTWSAPKLLRVPGERRAQPPPRLCKARTTTRRKATGGLACTTTPSPTACGSSGLAAQTRRTPRPSRTDASARGGESCA